MNIIVPEGTPEQDRAEEQFCADCYAGLTSSEHHEKCVAPLDQMDDERPGGVA